MLEVIYLSKSELAEILCKRFQCESVEFWHDDEFLPDEPDGIIVLCDNIYGEVREDLIGYLDVLRAVTNYVKRLGMRFCDWRLFTLSEGCGAVLLVKRR